VPEAPEKVQDGLGVGIVPESWRDLRPESNADKQLERSALTRVEAAKRADIARKRAYGFRAQSEALRHHADVLMRSGIPMPMAKLGVRRRQ